jgi:hypothetical protein
VTSLVITLKLASVHRTRSRSRRRWRRARVPSTRPMRGLLWRASNVYHWPIEMSFEPRPTVQFTSERFNNLGDVAYQAGCVTRIPRQHCSSKADQPIRRSHSHAALGQKPLRREDRLGSFWTSAAHSGNPAARNPCA